MFKYINIENNTNFISLKAIEHYAFNDNQELENYLSTVSNDQEDCHLQIYYVSDGCINCNTCVITAYESLRIVNATINRQDMTIQIKFHLDLDNDEEDDEELIVTMNFGLNRQWPLLRIVFDERTLYEHQLPVGNDQIVPN